MTTKTKKAMEVEIENTPDTEPERKVFKSLAAKKTLYATADFEIEKLGISVKAGEEFIPPADWKRNLSQEEFILASKKKNGDQSGMAFDYLGEVVNPQERNKELQERRVHTAVLPLEER